MLFDVLDDYLICDIARASHKVSSRPYMPPPKHPTQGLIFHHHFARTLPLQPLHQLADRNVGRNGDKDMDMIPGNMPLNDFYILTLTNFPDQLPGPCSNLTGQNRLAVFGDPYDVVFQIVNGMARLPIILHTASILKSSPEGEGFSLIPRMGQ